MEEIDIPNNIKYYEPEKSSKMLRDALQDNISVYSASASKRTVQLDDDRVVDAPYVDVRVKEPQYDSSAVKAQILDALEDFVVIEDNDDDEGSFTVYYTYRVQGETVAPLLD